MLNIRLCLSFSFNVVWYVLKSGHFLRVIEQIIRSEREVRMSVCDSVYKTKNTYRVRCKANSLERRRDDDEKTNLIHENDAKL